MRGHECPHLGVDLLHAELVSQGDSVSVGDEAHSTCLVHGDRPDLPLSGPPDQFRAGLVLLLAGLRLQSERLTTEVDLPD